MMSTQELVTSIVAEQEDGVDQFLDAIQQKIDDAIEVKRIELASQMFEAKGMCPECGEPMEDCECEDEDEDEELEEGYEEDKAAAPFDTSKDTRDATKPRKDRYGNDVKDKNRAKHLAKKGMSAAMTEEEVEQIDEKVEVSKANHHKATNTVWHVVKHHGEEIGTVGTNAAEHVEKHGKWGFEDSRGYGRKKDEPKLNSKKEAVDALVARHKAEYMNEEFEQIDEGGKENREKARKVQYDLGVKGGMPGREKDVTGRTFIGRRMQKDEPIKPRGSFKALSKEEFEQIDEYRYYGEPSRNPRKIAKNQAVQSELGGRKASKAYSGPTQTGNKKADIKARIADIRNSRAYGANLPEELEHVVTKEKTGSANTSSLGGQTLKDGTKLQHVYKNKKEAQAHADAINAERGYKPEDHKNPLYGGVLYKVFPRKSMNEEYTLHAVHDEMGTKKKLGNFSSKAAARSHINKLEDSDKFPEGHEAVVTHNKTGKKYVYTDRWEPIDEAAKWRSSSAAKPDYEQETDRHYETGGRSTGPLKATSDTKTPDYDRRRSAAVATQGARKGMVTRQHIERLKNKIRGKQAYGDKSKPHLPEEYDQIDERNMLNKQMKNAAVSSELGGRAASRRNDGPTQTGNKKADIKARIADIRNSRAYGANLPEEVGQIDEKAPPGAKYERMVKHIKKGYAKDGLTGKEKAIAYATAWKAKNREMSEAAMTDAQQMAAMGMKGSERAKTMMALSAYRRHGDINKLSAGHRSLLTGYMEKTGGLGSVNRSAAIAALKKERT